MVIVISLRESFRFERHLPRFDNGESRRLSDQLLLTCPSQLPAGRTLKAALLAILHELTRNDGQLNWRI